MRVDANVEHGLATVEMQISKLCDLQCLWVYFGEGEPVPVSSYICQRVVCNDGSGVCVVCEEGNSNLSGRSYGKGA